MNYKCTALPIEQFDHALNASDAELKEIGACWLVADESPGFPCRVSLEDARVDERVLAINFEHHNAKSPYRGSGPVFIRELAEPAIIEKNTIPTLFLHRQIALRGYDVDGMMIHALITPGIKLHDHILTAFENQSVSIIHLHYAIPGCYACAVHRC